MECDDLEATSNISHSMSGMPNPGASHESKCSRPVNDRKEEKGEESLGRNHSNDVKCWGVCGPGSVFLCQNEVMGP